MLLVSPGFFHGKLFSTLDIKIRKDYNNGVINNAIIDNETVERRKNMAVKDHSLDDKIVQSAKAEFMEYGFQKASLHKIAANAGITTGALYTRYKNKDALFCSLVKDAFAGMAEESEPMREQYMEAQKSRDVEKLIDAIKKEENIYLDLLFRHYEECILFFCKSGGSSIESMLNVMMKQKAEETVEFLKTIARVQIDFDGIELLMSEQFHYYREILERGYDKEKAISCMETVEIYIEAGWKALFEKIL